MGERAWERGEEIWVPARWGALPRCSSASPTEAAGAARCQARFHNLHLSTWQSSDLKLISLSHSAFATPYAGNSVMKKQMIPCPVSL